MLLTSFPLFQRGQLSPEIDVVSMEHFPAKRGVYMDKKLYDALPLARMISSRLPGGVISADDFSKFHVPHTRRPMTAGEFEAIFLRSGKVRIGNVFVSKRQRKLLRHRRGGWHVALFFILMLSS